MELVVAFQWLFSAIDILFCIASHCVCVSSRVRAVTYQQELRSTSASLTPRSSTSTCVATLAFRFVALTPPFFISYVHRLLSGHVKHLSGCVHTNNQLLR